MNYSLQSLDAIYIYAVQDRKEPACSYVRLNNIVTLATVMQGRATVHISSQMQQVYTRMQRRLDMVI